MKTKCNYHFNNQWAQIILNDAKGNIIDSVMMEELSILFSEFKKNKDLKVISIEGTGKNFSFGASVAEHKKEYAPKMLKNFHSLFFNIIELSIPLISKVSGYCLGGAMEIVLMSNIIFADKSAKFGQPEITLGVFPPPASILLPLKIGYSKAEELLITGETIDAQKAKELCIINNIFDTKEEMDKETESWIEKNILPKSASSLKYSVKAARIHLNTILRDKLPELEAMYINELMETKDANEGINAFLEKRKAQWENC